MNSPEPPAAESAQWRSLSACRDEDPEMFFPAPRSLTMFVQLARAKAICRGCPVSDVCLRYALTTGQDYGVWGGTSEEERKAMSRRLRVASPPVRPGPFPAQATGRAQPAARTLAAG